MTNSALDPPQITVEFTFSESAVYDLYDQLLAFERSKEYATSMIEEKEDIENWLNMCFELIVAMENTTSKEPQPGNNQK